MENSSRGSFFSSFLIEHPTPLIPCHLPIDVLVRGVISYSPDESVTILFAPIVLGTSPWTSSFKSADDSLPEPSMVTAPDASVVPILKTRATILSAWSAFFKALSTKCCSEVLENSHTSKLPYSHTPSRPIPPPPIAPRISAKLPLEFLVTCGLTHPSPNVILPLMSDE